MFKTTKPHITAYHADLKDYDRLSLKHEGTVKIAFQDTDFTVVIGNPPYNAGQANENDNNIQFKHSHI